MMRMTHANDIAVDGTTCQAVEEASYPLALGQRIDLLVEIPQAGGAFPIMAQVEAAKFVTGIVLATSGAPVTRLFAIAAHDQSCPSSGFSGQLSV